ncbi:methylmalonyl-CoA mutase family protein [Aquiflexum lacus]|uniref:methylmalonyl-CoA mutase family protein n=1 Tax=Aquiflexum lacus TaxID=2483805 RepID=UPI001894C480|nr:methylmalonyl-CoA mutase family protein [Aquiflexum lacus]
MKDNLFEEFPNISKKEWMQQVIKDLKGKDFEDTLVTKTADGLKIAPFYTAEDNKEGEPYLAETIVPNPSIPGFSPRHWVNVFEVEEGDGKAVNKEILLALQNGADALLLSLSGDENLDELLDEVLPQYIRIFIVPGKDPLTSIQHFFNWVKRSDFDPHEIQGGLLWDGFANILINKESKDNVIDVAAALLRETEEMDQFKVFAIDSAIYHNTGASPVQELSYSLSAFIELVDGLTQSGISAGFIFEKTLLKTAVGSDYFIEMTKIKTFRKLYHQLAKLYQISIPMENIFIFSSTSYWTKSKLDVHTNMLRSTTEAMAAILGGCNALQVLPHDIVFGPSDSFSKRMARNISNILKEEVYLDKVLDPMAGSFYLENLIGDMFTAVHSKLMEIENFGGWWHLYQKGSIQNTVKAMRDQKMHDLLHGETVKIGVNKFTVPNDYLEDGIKKIEAKEWQLLSTRESELIEQNQTQKS